MKAATLKTVCRIQFSPDYSTYNLIPLANVFASSNEEAIKSYLLHIDTPLKTIISVLIMEKTYEDKNIIFYRVIYINAITNIKSKQDFIVIDTDLIVD